jgi:LmbE family N-acetylglucosaminyl deacetylase
MGSGSLSTSSTLRSVLSLGALVCGGSTLSHASPARADILVVAPHPDDDVLTSAGVTYATRNSSEAVWIVYMTNGDSPGRTTGLLRQTEGAAAEALLGVDNAHLVFLGYPDGSLSTLRGSEYASPSSAYDSPNTDVGSTTYGSATFPPYSATSGTNGNNNAHNVRADLAHFINARRPRDIYVTGICDRHPDHSATYQFVVEAVQNVRSGVSSYDPFIHQTIVWAGFNAEDDWPAPTNPTTDYTEPVRIRDCMTESGLAWAARESIRVPAIMQSTDYSMNLKARAIDRHQSQGGFHAMTVRSPSDGHISAFVHRDEFFFSARAPAGNPRPVDAGTPPPVDSGTPPPVDSGTPPPVDSGTPPPVDSGTPPLDSGTQPVDAGTRLDASTDAGNNDPDAGSTQPDSGAALDGGQLPDAALADAGSPTEDAAIAEAGTDAGEAAHFGGTSASWPVDEGWEQNVDDLLHAGADPGEGAGSGGGGCSVAPSSNPQRFSVLFAALGLSSALLSRRRTRG